MPRKAVDTEVRLQSLNLKTTQELRTRLENAASASGRALTHEVEARLNRSFEYDFLLGDNETALVLRTLGTAIKRFEKSSGKEWVKDSATHEVVYEVASQVIDMLMKPDRRTDDQVIFDGPGLPVDLQDPEMRAGFRTMVLDERLSEFGKLLKLGLQETYEEAVKYRRLKEQELKALRKPPSSRA